jgi:hypothetical protein
VGAKSAQPFSVNYPFSLLFPVLADDVCEKVAHEEKDLLGGSYMERICALCSHKGMMDYHI